LIRVIHFISSLNRGGKERQLSTIYKYNDRQKQHIKIIYLNDRIPNYIEEFSIKQQDLIKIKADNFRGRVSEAYSIIKREKPVIVYAWGPLEAIICMIIRPFLGFIFINGSIRHGILSMKFSHYWRMLLLQVSKNVVANSHAGLKANFLRRGYVMYNGIDEKFFKAITPNNEILELKQKISSPVLISVANLVPYKDYFTVLEALAQLKREGYPFSYLILGDGPMKNEIISCIASLDLSEVVILLDSRNNVEEYLSIADLFIHSSKGEGCSNAILEAMAAGLPVIATNVGGTPEIVDNSNGILFGYKNSKELTFALKKFLSNNEIIKSLGSTSKEKAKKICSANAMMEKYYRISDEIADKNKTI
jgi:glycosyltransferase involved in cell wall biosynthesis